VASALAVLACDRGSTLDQIDLERVLAADESTSRALKRVDDASRAGDKAGSVDILKRSAVPAADDALSLATALAPRTHWGQTERGSLVALTTDRKNAMPSYERALEGDSDEETLAALSKQLEIEHRAAALLQDVERGP
jgi:hypothetical protein